MRIINVENKTNDKYADAIDMVLNDDYIVMSYDENIILYYGEDNVEEIDFQQFLCEIQNKMRNMDKKSPEYKKLEDFFNSRDIYNYSMMLRGNYDLTFSKKQFDIILKILTDETTRAKFIEFEENTEDFHVFFDNGIIQPSSKTKEGYMKIMASMFGRIDKDGKLSGLDLFKSYNIPDLQKYIESYLQLCNTLDFEKFVPKDYMFDVGLSTVNYADVIREGDIPEWDVNPDVIEEINEGMPEDLAPEEKAMWIYCKMCIIFLYDEGYLYRDKLDKVNYHDIFDKEHLESIRPRDKITCFDFSEIYAKLVNDMDAEIDGVIISTGLNHGHFLVGFSSPNGSAELEAVNGIPDPQNNVANDLLRAKLGTELNGIRILEDRNGIIKQAYEKIYPMILKQKIKSQTEIIMEQIKLLPSEELTVEEYLEIFLENLIRNMNERKVSGNEFTLLLNNILHKGFGTEIEKVYLGKMEKTEDEKFYIKRKIFLYKKGSESGYLIDTNSSLQNYNGGLSVEKIRISELKELLANKELILERDDKAIE